LKFVKHRRFTTSQVDDTVCRSTAEAYRRVIREAGGGDGEIMDENICGCDDDIKSMSLLVSGHRYVLYKREGVEKMLDGCSVRMIRIVEMYVEVTEQVYRIGENRQMRKELREFAEECR